MKKIENMWFEYVPSNWDVKKIKYATKLRNEKISELIEMVYLGLENIEPYTGKYFVDSNVEQNIEGTSNRFYKGDVLFGKLRPYLTKCIESDFEGVCTTELLVIKCNEMIINSTYLKYLLLSSKFIDEVNSSTFGAQMPRANWEFIKNVEIPLPDLKTQYKIAKFIQNKEQSVMALLKSKEKIIKLLEEKRQSIITEAVTKGFNPNVKMKDSGVEWIGEIPEHWQVKKVKHFSKFVGSGKTPSGGSEVYLEEGIPFLRSLNVHFDGIRLKNLAFISEETDAEMRSSRIQPLDNLLNITGASIGRSCIVPKDFGQGNVNQHVCIIRVDRNKINPYYLNSILNSKLAMEQVMTAQTGSSREGLNFQQVKNLMFPVAPLEEQEKLNQFIFDKQREIYSVINRIESQIQKLKEYRQSLIYEAVTGKIDVRELVAGK